MEITTIELMFYFAAWTIFYFWISLYIARLSKDKWVEWAKSTESDEDLLEILESVITEIEERTHEKLEQFQSSFFGSLGAASKKMDQATGQSTIKALTRDNPLMGFVADYMMKRGNLGSLLGSETQNTPPSKPNQSSKLVLE